MSLISKPASRLFFCVLGVIGLSLLSVSLGSADANSGLSRKGQGFKATRALPAIPVTHNGSGLNNKNNIVPASASSGSNNIQPGGYSVQGSAAAQPAGNSNSSNPTPQPSVSQTPATEIDPMYPIDPIPCKPLPKIFGQTNYDCVNCADDTYPCGYCGGVRSGLMCLPPA